LGSWHKKAFQEVEGLKILWEKEGWLDKLELIVVKDMSQGLSLCPHQRLRPD
jgi:hypothetical protein